MSVSKAPPPPLQGPIHSARDSSSRIQESGLSDTPLSSGALIDLRFFGALDVSHFWPLVLFSATKGAALGPVSVLQFRKLPLFEFRIWWVNPFLPLPTLSEILFEISIPNHRRTQLTPVFQLPWNTSPLELAVFFITVASPKTPPPWALVIYPSTGVYSSFLLLPLPPIRTAFPRPNSKP